MISRAALLAVAAIALAGFLGSPPTAGAGERVPMPVLAKAKGEACVLPKDEIRRQHPDLLKAQRDQTMREGIRGGKFSLKECVACHASPDPNIKDKVVLDVTGFCDQCHTYVGAQPDCWTCHNRTLDSKFDRSAWDQRESPDVLIARLNAELARKGGAR